MKKKKIERTKRVIRESFLWWVKQMGFGWWRDVTAVYVEREKDYNKIRDGIEGGNAYVEVDWEYLQMTIWFNVERNARRKKREIENTVIHELVHGLLAELVEYPDQKHEERVVVIIARAFQWVRDEAEKLGIEKGGGNV